MRTHPHTPNHIPHPPPHAHAHAHRLRLPTARLTQQGAAAQHVSVARALLKAGAEANAKDIAGFSPFHLATDLNAQAGSAGAVAAHAIAKMLPQCNGDPNARNRFGAVPLIEAVMARSMEMVSLLVHAGADPALEDLSCKAITPADLLRPEYNEGIPPAMLAMMAQRPEPEDNIPTTPFSIASTFPAARALFQRVAFQHAGTQKFTCSLPGCAKVAPAFCQRCPRAFYCCREHQLEDRAAHRPACKAAAGDLTRFLTVADSRVVAALRQSRGVDSQENKAFSHARMHCVKIQLGENGSQPGHDVEYDRTSLRVFEIRGADNSETFAALAKAIRERGVFGSKGYFNCRGWRAPTRWPSGWKCGA